MSVLVIVDHASNHVPPDIDLGIDDALLETHIAWDIGSAALAHALGYPVHLASLSRLVIDVNREIDSAGLVPKSSDGHAIPGNAGDMRDRTMRSGIPITTHLPSASRTPNPTC